MFNIFNSESLWIGTDMEMFNKIRTRLEQEGIPYKYKTKNHLSQTMFPAEGTLRSRTGSLGNDVDQMIEYEILVHKKDYEKAKNTNLLGTQSRRRKCLAGIFTRSDITFSFISNFWFSVLWLQVEISI